MLAYAWLRVTKSHISLAPRPKNQIEAKAASAARG